MHMGAHHAWVWVCGGTRAIASGVRERPCLLPGSETPARMGTSAEPGAAEEAEGEGEGIDHRGSKEQESAHWLSALVAVLLLSLFQCALIAMVLRGTSAVCRVAGAAKDLAVREQHRVIGVRQRSSGQRRSRHGT